MLPTLLFTTFMSSTFSQQWQNHRSCTVVRCKLLHIAHKKGISLKSIAFKGFADKNASPTNVSVKKGICL
jgi:hypothetical protein